MSFPVAIVMTENIFDDFDMIESALKANPEYEDWRLEPYDIFPELRHISPIISIVNAKGEVIASAGEGDWYFSCWYRNTYWWRNSSFPVNGEGGALVHRYYHSANGIISVYKIDRIVLYISASKNTEGIRVRVDGFYITSKTKMNGSPYDDSWKKTTGIAIYTVEEYVNEVSSLSPKVRSRLGEGSVIYKYAEEKRRAAERGKEEEKRRADEEAKKAIAAVTAESTDDFRVRFFITDALQIDGLSSTSGKRYNT